MPTNLFLEFWRVMCSGPHPTKKFLVVKNGSSSIFWLYHFFNPIPVCLRAFGDLLSLSIWNSKMLGGWIFENFAGHYIRNSLEGEVSSEMPLNKQARPNVGGASLNSEIRLNKIAIASGWLVHIPGPGSLSSIHWGGASKCQIYFQIIHPLEKNQMHGAFSGLRIH